MSPVVYIIQMFHIDTLKAYTFCVLHSLKSFIFLVYFVSKLSKLIIRFLSFIPAGIGSPNIECQNVYGSPKNCVRTLYFTDVLL